MQQREIGRSGIQASVVALGTSPLAGSFWGGCTKEQALATLEAAFDHGINLIDTAPLYGFGRGEELVGQAAAGRRDKVVIATKCGFVWNTDKGAFIWHCNDQGRTDGPSKYEVRRYLRPESIAQEVDASLRRLNTDYIDLLQVHCPDPTTPIADSMAALVRMQEQGKVRALGLSNMTLEQLDAYRAGGRIDAVQERFSLLDRHIEGPYLDRCREEAIAVLAYAPLESGLLTGKMKPDTAFPPADFRNDDPRLTGKNIALVNDLLEKYRDLAASHDVSMTQLMLAWTLAGPGPTHVLVGGRDPRYMAENARAGAIELSANEIETIDTLARALLDSGWPR